MKRKPKGLFQYEEQRGRDLKDEKKIVFKKRMMKNKNPMLIISIQTIPEGNKAITKDIIKENWKILEQQIP